MPGPSADGRGHIAGHVG
uniref:Uncharacterized protein n=1 Tax=Arundo donax TaxID=35708 RepID=A0A0A9F345_ARUDO